MLVAGRCAEDPGLVLELGRRRLEPLEPGLVRLTGLDLAYLRPGGRGHHGLDAALRQARPGASVEQRSHDAREPDRRRLLAPALQAVAGDAARAMLLVVLVARVEAVQQVELAQLPLAKLGAPGPAVLPVDQLHREARLAPPAQHGALELVGAIDRPLGRARRPGQLGERGVDPLLIPDLPEARQHAADHDADQVEHRIADPEQLRVVGVPQLALRLAQADGGHVVLRIALRAHAGLQQGEDLVAADLADLGPDVPRGQYLERAGARTCLGGIRDQRQIGDHRFGLRLQPPLERAALRGQDRDRGPIAFGERAALDGGLQQTELLEAVACAAPSRSVAPQAAPRSSRRPDRVPGGRRAAGRRCPGRRRSAPARRARSHGAGRVPCPAVYPNCRVT